MNSSFLLATKAKLLNATMVLGDADPFQGVGNLAKDWTGRAIAAGLLVLALGATVTLIVFGFGGDQLRNKMKAKLGYIVLAVIGLAAIVGGIPWLYNMGKQWFGA